jgi:mono/diheme cytochrome c family protein
MSQNAKTLTSAGASEFEPQAGKATMPVWLLVALLLLFFGGGLYFDSHGGWFSQQVYAPYRSVNQLALFQPASGADRAIARGKVVYEQVCALCHGTDGLGKPGQAPPFVGSEWVLTDKAGHLIRIPLQGLNGPIKVKGVEWNLAMPAMGAALPDEDLAAVLTYMRNSWGNKASEITADDVKAVRSATASRTQPWTAAELDALP